MILNGQHLLCDERHKNCLITHFRSGIKLIRRGVDRKQTDASRGHGYG